MGSPSYLPGRPTSAAATVTPYGNIPKGVAQASQAGELSCHDDDRGGPASVGRSLAGVVTLQGALTALVAGSHRLDQLVAVDRPDEQAGRPL